MRDGDEFGACRTFAQMHEQNRGSAQATMEWHWNCAGALCTKNWRNEGLEFYTLTPIGKRNDELKASYMKVFMNENINWKKQGICSAHWSKGRRESIEDPSDVVCTEDYIVQLEKSKLRCANDKYIFCETAHVSFDRLFRSHYDPLL